MAGVQIKGIKATSVSLTRVGQRTTEAARIAVERGAFQIRDRAREYAPIDEGNLEKAISVPTPQRSKKTNRYIYRVTVDSRKLGEGYQTYGFRYDLEMHEGQYDLGPKSAKKQEASGKLVGPKYLARAYTELTPEITEKVLRAMKESIPK